MSKKENILIPAFVLCCVSFLLAESRYYPSRLFKPANPPDKIIGIEDSLLLRKKQRDSIYLKPYKRSTRPRLTPQDRHVNQFVHGRKGTPMLPNASIFKHEIELGESSNYRMKEKVGDNQYRPHVQMSLDEFTDWQERERMKQYWKSRSESLDGEGALGGRRLIPLIPLSPVLDRVFGGYYVDITPTGFVTLDFGGRWQNNQNPATSVDRQSVGNFEFDQQIKMNIVGKVGEKLAININYDNNATFDFQNNVKVAYTGFEEEIIKKIEIGNVSMETGNSLIRGAQTLFGVKTQLQFGKLYVTGIVTTQRGSSSSVSLENGSQKEEFQLIASNYEDNQHFFLSHFFRENYERWASNYPVINSGLIINQIEVYLVNQSGQTETLRNIMAFTDLGESSIMTAGSDGGSSQIPNQDNYPSWYSSVRNFSSAQRSKNQVEQNVLAQVPGLSASEDYELISTAKRLGQNEYVVNKQLGYISLTSRLQPDKMIAVSYNFTYRGEVYQVGELQKDYGNRNTNSVIFLKLLKPQKLDTQHPTWDLMMKNIYNLQATNIDRNGFQLRVIYRDDETGVDNPSLPETKIKGKQLVGVLGVDKLNQQGDPGVDGIFDFVQGQTISPRTGRIFFPTLEPFGETIRQKIDMKDESKYVFIELYEGTKADARLNTIKDKYYIVGSFTGASSNQIRLPGINVAKESVIVTAEGSPLQEGTQYTVNYDLGTVTILDESIINSGRKIDISFEKPDLFSLQTKTLLGTRFDYQLNDEMNFGATLLYLNERPVVSRVNIGQELVSNTKFGFDFNIQKESRFLTKMIDALPVIQTKVPSSIAFSGEFAQLIPGSSNKVNGQAVSYIDDFEGSAVPISLDQPLAWKHSSVPIEFNPNKSTALNVNFNRGKIAWYQVDRGFYTSLNNFASNIVNEDMQNHYVRNIQQQEVYRGRDLQQTTNFLRTFDVAYFPQERGIYNFNSSLNANGDLNSAPTDQWAGITRSITSNTDFDQINVAYIEFWMMDPFLSGDDGRILDGKFNQNADPRGGTLVFNLGNISEDIIPDGQHAFENGLPRNGNLSSPFITSTNWGYVTLDQYQRTGFSTNQQELQNQDVGLDGLDDAVERTFFSQALGGSLSQVNSDPAADNFQHFLDNRYTNSNAKVIQRYKMFNGIENNSSSEGQTPSGTSIATITPDNEDLNNDNTLNEINDYFSIEVPLSKSVLDPARNLYVADQQQIRDPVTNDIVSWYLMRIPIRGEHVEEIGNPSYKTIRFFRMYLKGFHSPVILRMADLQLIGSQWWIMNPATNYEDNSQGLIEDEKSRYDALVTTVVSREENERSTFMPYRTPPGVNTDSDPGSIQQIRLNEQALQLTVENLQDGKNAMVYKNINLDLVNYGRVKMPIHAHRASENDQANDDDVVAIFRIGTDIDQNFYQVEIPLKLVPLNPGAGITAEGIWPKENELDISLLEFYVVKNERDRLQKPISNIYGYKKSDSKYWIGVVGRPNLSEARVISLGIRNPAQRNAYFNPKEIDDGNPKSISVWFNELRVTDFDKTNGWAGNARVQAKLADLAQVTVSTRYTSIGFGSIQQKISERARNELFSYSASMQLQIDKFIPGKTGIKIPVYASYDRTTSTPQFDPVDPDIKLESKLGIYGTEGEKQDYRDKVISQETSRSINFTNVHKEKVKEGAKSRIYDVENLSITFAYSDNLESSYKVAENYSTKHNVGLGYNYNIKSKPLTPFAKVSFLQSPYLALIKDFNLSILPSSINARYDLSRDFNRKQFRDALTLEPDRNPLYQKLFTFNRSYSVNWSLAESLNMDYSAKVNAVIDEPYGELNDVKRDSIITQLMALGRKKTFNQSINWTYRFPLSKFPLTDFLSADAQYKIGYVWQAGAINQVDEFGDNISNNTISNSRVRSINGKTDMVKLYNKIPMLKNANTPSSRKRQPSRGGQEEVKGGGNNQGVKSTLRFLMMLRSVNARYSLTESTFFPGYLPEVSIFGLNEDFDTDLLPFILGSQDKESLKNTIINQHQDWFTLNPNFSNSLTQSVNEDLSFQGTIEPINEFNIQLSFKKGNTNTYNEIFIQDELGDFQTQFQSRTSTYNTSFFTLLTSFVSDDSENNSPVFEEFVSNRFIIKNRIGRNFNIGSQEVLVPAFLAAYSGRSVQNISLNPFPSIPLPNWRIDFSGLKNVPWIKEKIPQLVLSHGYTSTYSVSGIQSVLDYAGNANFFDLSNHIENLGPNDAIGGISPYVYSTVGIKESFSPLIGVKIRTKNNWDIQTDYKITRDIRLDMTSSQVAEQYSENITLTLGYRKTGIKLPFRFAGRVETLRNELIFKMAFSIKDNITIQRKIFIDENNGSEHIRNQLTNGSTNIRLNPTVEYSINQRLNLIIYFERTINTPKTTNAFPTTTTAAGFRLRFNLAQ